MSLCRLTNYGLIATKIFVADSGKFVGKLKNFSFKIFSSNEADIKKKIFKKSEAKIFGSIRTRKHMGLLNSNT